MACGKMDEVALSLAIKCTVCGKASLSFLNCTRFQCGFVSYVARWQVSYVPRAADPRQEQFRMRSGHEEVKETSKIRSCFSILTNRATFLCFLQ